MCSSTPSQHRSPVIWAAAFCWSLASVQSCSDTTTTKPQFNVLLRLRVCVRVWKLLWLPLTHCSSFACGSLGLGFGSSRFTTALTLLHTPLSLPPRHSWKHPEKKSFLLKSGGCSPLQPESQSMSHLFGLPPCLARAHLELHSTLPSCGNDTTH